MSQQAYGGKTFAEAELREPADVRELKQIAFSFSAG